METYIDELQLYTDGGCRGNPGPGAIGVIILAPNRTDSSGILRLARLNIRMSSSWISRPFTWHEVKGYGRDAGPERHRHL
jgi:hypothetical protein